MGKKSPSTDEDMAELPFEQAMAELEDITTLLEDGSGDLVTLVDKYERGMKLMHHCTLQLDLAQLRVESVTKTPQGVTTAPFDPANAPGASEANSAPSKSRKTSPSAPTSASDDEIRLF